MSALMGLCGKMGRNFFNDMEHHRVAVVQDLAADGGEDEQESSFIAQTILAVGLRAMT